MWRGRASCGQGVGSGRACTFCDISGPSFQTSFPWDLRYAVVVIVQTNDDNCGKFWITCEPLRGICVCFVNSDETFVFVVSSESGQERFLTEGDY